VEETEGEKEEAGNEQAGQVLHFRDDGKAVAGETEEVAQHDEKPGEGQTPGKEKVERVGGRFALHGWPGQ
jgi:hypothetical protein